MSNEQKKPICAYARVATRAQITGMATPEQSRKAYVYTRVGGGGANAFSDTSSFLIEAQHKRLRECAESMGFEVVEQDAEFARWGITKGAERKLLDAASSGCIGVLMIMSCSRLSRKSEKAIDLLEELDNHGIQIYSLNEGWLNVPCEEEQPTMLQLLQMMRMPVKKEGDLSVIPG